MTQMTQVTLLQQYATRRDPEAFAKLVEQYQRLIFSTCRRKLHNSQDVDDAVQETFLRLAHKAGELHSNIGGWLHRCAVNVSTDMNRRRAARMKHEHAAAAETPVGVENVGVELSELREHLDAALEKLDPEQRELIIQRYFLGRAQVEMAEELNVSPSTMTRRLEAAIEAMRGHLQAMGSKTVGAVGAGAVIATALQAETASAAVPASLTANIMKIGLSGTGASATTATAATGGALFGAGAMKALISVAAALLVAGGAVVAVVNSQKPPPAPANPAPAAARDTVTADVAVTIAANTPARLDAGGTPLKWATSQVAAGSAALEGVIRDADGKPIPNATVTLQGSQYQTAKTDAEGRYTFQTIANAGEYRIGVDAAGFVSIQPYRTRDAAVQLTPQSKARRDIVLQRGVAVRVTVKDVTGQGMQNVGVDTNIEGGDYRTQPAERVNTNELGVAMVTLPVSAAKYVVAASKDEFEPTHALVTPASSDKPIDLELTLLPGVPVKGVALCNDGKPAAGWDISAKPPWWSSNYIPKSAVIDAQGNFTLTNVGSGKYELTVWRKNSDGGGTSVMTSTVHLPASKQPIRLDIPVPSPASMVKLAGKVKLIGGGRPDYVQVTAMGSDGQWNHASVRFGPRPALRRPAATRGGATRQAATRPAPTPPDEGTFTFDGLTPGTYTLRFESPMIETKTLENIKVPGELPDVIEIKSAGKPKIAGTVVDAETGKPITHFGIRVNKTETIGDGPNYVQDPHWIQVSNPQGKFSVDLVGPGIYAAQVSLDGYAWTWSTPVRIEKSGGIGNVEIKVTKGGSLSGRVVDSSGKGIAGAKVIPYSTAKSTANRADGRFDGDAGAAVTDGEGNFTVEHLAAGSEKLKIVSPRHAPRIVEKLTVADGRNTPVETIKLSGGASVEGTVFDERGKPQPGVTLQFQDASGYGGGGDEEAGRLAIATTDDNGKYRVDNLAADQVVFVNVAERWNRQGVVRRVVRPLEGKVARLDFGGETKVSGRLVDSKKQPVRGVRIELSTDSPHFGAVMVNSRTDEDGKFAFFGPPPGKYGLFFMPPRDERRSEWTSAGRVDVTGQAIDLGEIVNDTGDVIVTVEAEDPADLKKVRYVSASTDQKNRMWQDSIGRGTQEPAAGANTWKIIDVTPGAFRVTANLGETNVAHVARGERKPGAAETKITLRIPKATASIAITSSAAASAPNPGGGRYMQLRNEDDTVQAYVSLDSTGPKTVQLPPGTYRELDPRTNEPRADVQPIVLKAGDNAPFTHTALPQHANEKRTMVNVCFWQPDGVLAVGDVKLLDASGKEAESRGSGALGRLFAAAPGKYQAVFTQPGKPPVTKEVTIEPSKPAGPDDATGGGRWTPANVVLD